MIIDQGDDYDHEEYDNYYYEDDCRMSYQAVEKTNRFRLIASDHLAPDNEDDYDHEDYDDYDYEDDCR